VNVHVNVPVPVRPDTDRTAVDPEAAYYQAVEEFFVSLRGDPLFCSNADWFLIRKWRQAGIPLRIVLRGIQDALESHAHSWGRRRKVGSLAYCAGEVDVARDRWQRALGLGEEPGMRAADTLLGLARALEDAGGLGPRAGPRAQAVARDLRLWAGEARLELEPCLREAEEGLLAALRADAGPDVIACIEAEVAAELAPYRERMPARVVTQIERESVARRILALHGLPRISLFDA